MVHLSWMCGEKLKVADLCFRCAGDSRTIDDAYGLKLLQLLHDLHGNMSQSIRTCCREELQKCPVCQFPLEKFKKTGLVGCPECYTHLCQDELDAALQLAHRGLIHQGKVPGGNSDTRTGPKIKSKSAENDLSYSV